MPPLFPAAAWRPSLNNLGLYLHVPFCKSKCAYCDFYSFNADGHTKTDYTAVLQEHLKLSGARLCAVADTLYFGGGTPSLLGGERISTLIETAKTSFGDNFKEITVEVNPGDDLEKDFKLMKSAGVNRLSIGVQSALPDELKALSRRHSAEDAKRTVELARLSGITNISVDLMLGIPNQTKESLAQSLEFVLSLNPTHVSCYILKIEPQTTFGKANINELNLPDDDTVADLYLQMCEFLGNAGLEHYEVSNFALPGYHSKHNMKYWNCEEYLGLGPSAHSFINGKRYYFERDLNKYLTKPEIIFDDNGGTEEEYLMLRLRLIDGVDFNEYTKKFGKLFPSEITKRAHKFAKVGLVSITENGFHLTEKGFLVSNSVISDLIL